MPKKKKSSKFSFFRNRSKIQILAFVLVFAAIGSYFIYKSFALNRIVVNKPAVAIGEAGGNGKYWITTTDGGIFSMGGATFSGSMGGKTLAQPVTSIAVRPQHDGYWLLGGDGGVFGFGSAGYHGSLSVKATTPFYKAIVETPDGNGYWIIGNDGRVAIYGSAGTYSSTAASGHSSINQDITKYNTTSTHGLPGLPSGGIVAAGRSASGHGLLLIASSGATYAYGDMPNRGAPGTALGTHHAVGVAVTATNGYFIVAENGAVYAYGATYYGGANNLTLAGKIVSMDTTPDDKGYWLLGQDGGIFSYGDAVFNGAVQAPTYQTCWNNTQVLSTATCPPKITCWDGSFVTDASKCPIKPAPPTTTTGGGSSGGSGSTGGTSGGGTTCNAICDAQKRLNGDGEHLTPDGIMGPLTHDACSRHPNDCTNITWMTPAEQAAFNQQFADSFGCGSFGISTTSCGGSGSGSGSGGGYVSTTPPTPGKGCSVVYITCPGSTTVNSGFMSSTFAPTVSKTQPTGSIIISGGNW